MAEDWTDRRERGNRLGLLLLVTITRLLGRRIARLILHPVVGYFLLTAPAARTASRDYLRRVLDRKPRWRDLYRHMHCFACVTLDRIYMFDDASGKLQVTRHGYEAIEEIKAAGEGALLIVAHHGSFEVLRGTGSGRTHLKVLMDRAAGAKANAVIAAASPATRESLIDTSESDVDRVLKVKTVLDKGGMVGLMADRHDPEERTAECRFLGDMASFPLTPWLLANVARAPVVLVFGLYRGGNRYELHFEKFSERVKLARGRREQEAQAYAQAYADRLARYAAEAPYNWFNFFDFWRK